MKLPYLYLRVFLFLFCISFIHTVCYPQIKNKPKKYFDYINKAELAICDSNYLEAVRNYKIAFRYLKEPFGEDLNNFLWSGLIANDKEAIRVCIPFYKERNYRILKGGEKEIGKYIDSLCDNYPRTSKIDTNYRLFLEQLATKDQSLRREIGNLPFEKSDSIKSLIDIQNMLLFKNFIDSVGQFPTESIVGNIDNRANGALIYEILFIHYGATVGTKGNTQNPINIQLDEKVLKGEFPPDLYAHLCDSRKYGIDGKIRTTEKFHSTFLVTYKNNGTEKRVPEIKIHEFTVKELKKLNSIRKKMNMESYQDLLKKVYYQVNIKGKGEPFQLINSWLIVIAYL